MEAIELVSPFQQDEKPEPKNEFHRRLLEMVEAEAKEKAFSENVNIKYRDIQWY